MTTLVVVRSPTGETYKLDEGLGTLPLVGFKEYLIRSSQTATVFSRYVIAANRKLPLDDGAILRIRE